MFLQSHLSLYDRARQVHMNLIMVLRMHLVCMLMCAGANDVASVEEHNLSFSGSVLEL